MSKNITDPPTEPEIAALIRSLDAFPEHQMVARRMAFEIDRLKAAPAAVPSTEQHNAWVDSLKEDVEFEPLRDFIEKLKE